MTPESTGFQPGVILFPRGHLAMYPLRKVLVVTVGVELGRGWGLTGI